MTARLDGRKKRLQGRMLVMLQRRQESWETKGKMRDEAKHAKRKTRQQVGGTEATERRRG